MGRCRTRTLVASPAGAPLATRPSSRREMDVQAHPDGFGIAEELLEGRVHRVVLDRLDIVERQARAFRDILDRGPESLAPLPQRGRDEDNLGHLLDPSARSRVSRLGPVDVSLEVVRLPVFFDSFDALHGAQDTADPQCPLRRQS